METESQDTHGTANVASNEKQTKPSESKEPDVKQPSYEELLAERTRQSAEISRLGGLLRATSRQSITRDDFNALRQELGDNMKLTAQMLDEIVQGNTAGLGNDGIVPSAQRASFMQRVEERQKAEKERPQPEDPVARSFVTYMESHGLNWNSPEVKDALGETDGIIRSPQEALDALKGKVDGKAQETIQAEAKRQAELLLETRLKDLGFAGTGAIAPNAPGQGDLNSMSARELIVKGLTDQSKQKEE
jgi:hypothetical protein